MSEERRKKVVKEKDEGKKRGRVRKRQWEDTKAKKGLSRDLLRVPLVAP